jgi:hypothetical protein
MPNARLRFGDNPSAIYMETARDKIGAAPQQTSLRFSETLPARSHPS